MVFIRKGTGERVDADDPEVKAHPERFVAHGDNYRKELAEQRRRQRADKKARDARRKR